MDSMESFCYLTHGCALEQDGNNFKKEGDLETAKNRYKSAKYHFERGEWEGAAKRVTIKLGDIEKLLSERE